MAKLKLFKDKTTFKPVLSGPEARIQKRRASQAKHRHNLAACFKNLHGVLPEEDITKLRTPGQSRPDILQDAFSGIKTNRTMLLSRAKNYVLHLESVVGMLIAEKNKLKHNTFTLGVQGSQYLRMSNDANRQFRSMKDVRRSFLSNFELERSIDDYTFCRLDESDEGEGETETGVNKNNTSLHGQPHLNSIAQPTLNSNAISTDVNPLVLIPINVQPMFDNAPVYVSATSPSLHIPHSPTNISVDLGFVSAENASQETHDTSSHAIMRNSIKNASSQCFPSSSMEKLAAGIEKLLDQCNSPPHAEVLLQLQLLGSSSHENVGQLINVIKAVGKKLCTLDNSTMQSCLVKTLCQFYFHCITKHPCKRKFASLLLSTSLDRKSVVQYITDCLTSALDGTPDFELSVNHVVQTLEHISQTFSGDVISQMSMKALQFVANALQNHYKQLAVLPSSATEAQEKLIHKICDDLKCATTLIQKQSRLDGTSQQVISGIKPCESNQTEIIRKLYTQCTLLFHNESIGWECWNAAGLLFPYLIRAFHHDGIDACYQEVLCAFGVFSIRNLFQFSENKPDLLCHQVCASAFVGICNGCLVLLNGFSLKENKKSGSNICQNGSSTNGHCHTNGVSTNGNSELSPHQIFALFDVVFQSLKFKKERNFIKWKHAVDWPVLNGAIACLQSYLAVGLDHPVDVIRHQSRDTLMNIMAIGSSSSNPGSSMFAEDVISNVVLWDWHKRSVYVSLQCVLDHVSLDYLLDHHPDLREKLLTASCSQSLAPYASQLYSQLAQKHLRAEAAPHDVHFLIKQMDVWLKPSLRVLCSCDLHQSRLVLDYCVTKLLKLYGRPAVSYAVAHLTKGRGNPASCRHTNKHLNTLIMCLRASQHMGLLQHLDSHDGTLKETIDQQDIKTALVHSNNQIRLDSISLVCESWKPTVLITESDIELVKYFLPYNVNCQCPAFRQQILNTIKKFLNRLSLNMETMVKKKSPKPDDEAILLSYKDFRNWLIVFSFDQLFYGASYPRKSMALNMLHFICSSMATSTGDDIEATTKLFTTKRTLLLIGMLKDTYEDNRNLALDILTTSAVKGRVKRTLGNSFLWDLLYTSLDSGRRSCKPDVCRDAAFTLRFIARTCPGSDDNIITMVKYFVACLRDDVKVATRNLRKAVRTGPMHGSLYCLRMLLTDADIGSEKHRAVYRSLLSSCVELCYEVATAVFSVVGSDSPEGCIPEATDDIPLTDFQQRKYLKLLKIVKSNSQKVSEEETEDVDHSSSQRVLVTCWRSAKESYLLLQLISSIAPLDSASDEEDGVLSCQQFLAIGEHLRTQLMETVHRGTFEVAYSAFRDYCPLLWRSKHESLSARPKQWVVSTISDICNPITAKNICVTRRSAGLPFFMQALLGCDKGQVARDCLGHVMNALLSLVACDVISGLKVNDECVCQIHALNVLRGLVKDASLAEEIQPYLSRCIMVAITGFACKSWTIRNSSTLLFSSLVARVFGVKKEKDLEASGKNRLSSHEFFSRMPQLGEFLLVHLKRSVGNISRVCDIERQSSLYPVLLLLSRVHPSSPTHQESNNILASFVPLLTRCGDSPILKCRLMSATALTSVVSSVDYPKLLRHLAESLDQDLPSNQTHGILLELTKMISVRCDDKNDFSSEVKIALLKVLDLLRDKVALGTRANTSLVTRGAFIDLSIELISTLNRIDEQITDNQTATSLLDELITDVAKDLGNAELPSQPRHAALYESFGKLFAFAYMWFSSWRPTQTLLQCDNTEALLAFLRVLKKHFKTESRSDSLEKSELHALLEEGLVVLLTKQPDLGCTAKTYSILSFIISPKNCDKVLALTRQLAAKTILASEKLLGAVVSCQAVCLRGLLDQTSGELPETILEWLPSWLTLLTSGCSIVRHDACVRMNVANALRTNATQLLVDPGKRLGPICIDAWRILFILLVDDDEGVRGVASHVVMEIARSCSPTFPDEPLVDLLAIETALDCLVTFHSAAHPERVNAVLHHVTLMSDNESQPLDGARESQLFDCGATNSFIETQLLQRLVQATRVQIQPVR